MPLLISGASLMCRNIEIPTHGAGLLKDPDGIVTGTAGKRRQVTLLPLA